MPLRTHITAFALVFLPILALAMGSGPNGQEGRVKPGSAVYVSIEPTAGAGPRPGDTSELRITAGTGIAGPLEVKVKLTGGVELVSGELSWRADLGPGGITSGLITVRFPEKGAGKVMASASIREAGPHGARYSAAAVLRAGGPDETPRGREAMDGEGRGIIEYRAE